MSTKSESAAIRTAPASGEPPRMSIEEWAAMPEDDPGELVDGRLVEEEVADYAHETIVSFVNALVRGWAAPRGGFVGGSEAKLAVGAGLGRKPDLSVYLPGGNVPTPHGPVRVPPDIVVEVISPLPMDARRDRVEKVHDYAAFGVRWYWIIDPGTKTLEVFERTDDRRYMLALAAAEGRVTLPGCGDLMLDLDELWAELGRLDPVEPRMDAGQEEEDPATTIANCVSDCMNAAAMIVSPRVWRWHCATTTAAARKQLIFEALAGIARAAPLLDLPNVVGPKDQLRQAAAIATDLERAVTTWDAVADPPPAVVSLARNFLTCFGVPEGYEFPTPDDPLQH
jgi:Uma2 family endonuclease